jgi:protein-tyrosine phosphatase
VEGHSTVYTDNLEEYQAIAAIVMNPEMRPIHIHCAGGSVRTGYTAVLIQLILDVTEISVYEDFLLTNDILGDTYDQTLDEFRQMIIDNTGQEPTEQDMENLSNMVIIYPEYLDAALYHVRNLYGSIDAYIRDGLGITDAARSRFQSELGVGTTPF